MGHPFKKKTHLRTIISAGLQGSIKRAYNQKVLRCSQTLFTYGIGKGEASSVSRILHHIKQLAYCCFQLFQRRFLNWTKPHFTSLLLGTIMDLSRGKAELLAENALLRQLLIVLRRQIKRPKCTTTDRLLLVLLARAVRTWRQALYIIQPKTLLALASPSISCMAEAQGQSNVYKTKDLSRGHRID